MLPPAPVAAVLPVADARDARTALAYVLSVEGICQQCLLGIMTAVQAFCREPIALRIEAKQFIFFAQLAQQRCLHKPLRVAAFPLLCSVNHYSCPPP